MPNMITFTITDSQDSVTHEFYDAPFADAEVSGGEEEIITLNGNVYVDFIYTKRKWTRKFSFLKEAAYLQLKEFQERQRTTYKFPLLSIPEFGIDNVPVYLQISDRKTTNSCGDVVNVTLTMRETVQQ